jgi:tetratricopeptide (TPR) repeat protein
MNANQRIKLTGFSIIFVFLLPSYLFAVNTAKSDSILTVIRNAGSDTDRINAQLALYTEIQYSNPDGALKLAVEALHSAEQTGYKRGIANAERMIGLSYFFKSKYDSAKSYYDNSLVHCEELNDSLCMAKAILNLASIENYKGQLDAALSLYLKSLSILERMNEKQIRAKAYNNIGLIHRKLYNYDKALQYYFSSLKIKEETGDQQGICNTLDNISGVYADQKKYKDAIEYNLRSLKIRESIDDKVGIAYSYVNLGINYAMKEDNNLALEYLLEGFKRNEKLENDKAAAETCPHIGKIYAIKKDYSNALLYLQKGIDLTKQLGVNEIARDCYHGLSNTYKKMNDFKKSNEALEIYIELKDSIMTADKNKALVEMETKYDTEKKDNSIKLLNKDKEIQSGIIEKQKVTRNFMWAGFGAFTVFSGISLFFYYQKKKSAFDVKVQEVEMTALRAQMNPHFIFNSLNSIHRYMQQNDHRNASEYLIKFSRLMRLILENSRFQEVPVEKDMTALDLYMQLEALRMDHKFKFEIIIDPEIDTESTLIPPLILQPFVENSIWHGIQHKEGNGKITIQLKKEGEMINCSVEDNGVGRKKATEMKVKAPNHKGESLGMKITNARIDIINKIKNTDAKVLLTDLAEGVRVDLKLPLEMSY